MTYQAPVSDILFTLQHVDRFAHSTLEIDRELTEALFGGAAQIAEQVLHPLDRKGDRLGAEFRDGTVRMPAGFRAALETMRAFIAAATPA